MEIDRWELFFECARFYEGADDNVADNFYLRAYSFVLSDPHEESAAAAVVLHHLAEYLEKNGKMVEAKDCEKRFMRIMRTYAKKVLTS